MTLSDFLNDLKNAILPPKYVIVSPMNPVPIQAVPPGSTTNPASTETATLVSGSGHPKGTSSDNRSSLISGR